MTVEFTHWSDWICAEHVDEVSIVDSDKTKWRAFHRYKLGGGWKQFVGDTPREAVEKYITWHATTCLLKN